MSTFDFSYLEDRLFCGVSRGVAEGLRRAREQERDRIVRPMRPVHRMLTTETVVEWAVRGDQYVMDAALPYLQQGMFVGDAFNLICQHLVPGTETDYFCTNYLLRKCASDCDRWRAILPNLRHTTALYAAAKFIVSECDQAPA